MATNLALPTWIIKHVFDVCRIAGSNFLSEVGFIVRLRFDHMFGFGLSFEQMVD